MIERVAETIEAIERRIDELRVAVREAVLAGDNALATANRAQLRRAEQAWDDALSAIAAPPTRTPAARATPFVAASPGSAGSTPSRRRAEPPQPAEPAQRREPAQRGEPAQPAEPEQPAELPGSLLPLREQVYEALSLLQVPAAPKLIATVHEAFFGSTFPTTRVTSLKRDEERSFRAAPFARPYYICAALSADYLAPSRGLLAVSTWPLERRMIGSLSPRVDFLTAAMRVADAIERIPEPPLAARRLLQRFAASIPGGSVPGSGAGPDAVAAVKEAAAAELTVHADADDRARRAAAERARQLKQPEQLFGTASFRELAREAAGE